MVDDLFDLMRSLVGVMTLACGPHTLYQTGHVLCIRLMLGCGNLEQPLACVERLSYWATQSIVRYAVAYASLQVCPDVELQNAVPHDIIIGGDTHRIVQVCLL